MSYFKNYKLQPPNSQIIQVFLIFYLLTLSRIPIKGQYFASPNINTTLVPSQEILQVLFVIDSRADFSENLFDVLERKLNPSFAGSSIGKDGYVDCEFKLLPETNKCFEHFMPRLVEMLLLYALWCPRSETSPERSSRRCPQCSKYVRGYD